jgi:histidinol-phosphatase (PHP family)
MILTDFHVHSDVSADCSATMREMVEAEARQGVGILCFTNHSDIRDWRTLGYQPRCREIVPESRQKLAALRAEGALPAEVLLGVELAEGQFRPEVAAEIAADEALDFVLGSLHILPETGDFCWQHYTDAAQCDRYFDRYLDELQKVAALDCFDVMAHIGYCRRYMWRAGVDAALTLDKYGDRVRFLLRTLIDKGKGIEINCSGLRDGCGPFPSAEILRLYRDLGGELVTVGSDAHSPKTAAACLQEGHALLRECGFDYVTVFRRRKPEFIRL